MELENDLSQIHQAVAPSGDIMFAHGFRVFSSLTLNSLKTHKQFHYNIIYIKSNYILCLTAFYGENDSKCCNTMVNSYFSRANFTVSFFCIVSAHNLIIFTFFYII